MADRTRCAFGYRALQAGTAVFRFSVSGGAEHDGLEQSIPVELPTSLEAVAVAGDTTDVRREALLPPQGMRSDVGGLEVTLASTALGGFGEAMRQLVDYPYGCLEQLSSRLVPFVALRELSGRFNVPWKPDTATAWVSSEALAEQGAKDPDALIRQTVKTIERLQNVDGGYRYWASDGCSAEWASAYAVLALGRAADVGYPVDRAALKRGQEFLAKVVATGVGVALPKLVVAPNWTTRRASSRCGRWPAPAHPRPPTTASSTAAGSSCPSSRRPCSPMPCLSEVGTAPKRARCSPKSWTGPRSPPPGCISRR